jgi:hypothetical protein
MNKTAFAFEKDMYRIYHDAKRECAYAATRYKQMVEHRGGLATAHELLRRTPPPDAMKKLADCGRLDLTVEALVLKQEYRSMFTETELAEARRRLEQYGWDGESSS